MWEFLIQLFTNPILVSCILSYVIASMIKMFFHYLAFDEFNPAVFFKTGGMPSSHTASVSAMTTAIFLLEGFSNLFFVCILFSTIVISDAIGVRRSAGKQAQVLNKMVDEFKYFKRFKTKELYELLGHTPRQVLAGFILGVFVTILVFRI